MWKWTYRGFWCAFCLLRTSILLSSVFLLDLLGKQPSCYLIKVDWSVTSTSDCWDLGGGEWKAIIEINIFSNFVSIKDCGTFVGGHRAILFPTALIAFGVRNACSVFLAASCSSPPSPREFSSEDMTSWSASSFLWSSSTTTVRSTVDVDGSTPSWWFLACLACQWSRRSNSGLWKYPFFLSFHVTYQLFSTWSQLRYSTFHVSSSSRIFPLVVEVCPSCLESLLLQSQWS